MGRRRHEAKLAVDRAVDKDVPVTQAEWTEWLGANETHFRQLMQTAPATRRRSNHRMAAAADAPPAAARIRPADKRADTKKDLKGWQQVLWGRSGWVCLARGGKAQRLLWLSTAGGQTYCLDLTGSRRGKEHVLDEEAVRALQATFRRLGELDVEEVDQALVCSVKALAEPGQVRLLIHRPVQEPLHRARRGRKRSAPGADADDEVAGVRKWRRRKGRRLPL